ncbi:phosphate transport system substrate-binding protein [Erythromicrobium ramosum]|uniref:Phosphate transport system substrate-binding protein n=2 Tax=Erythrobacter ramosus TaxID=35811 RepID=A0ABR6HUZ1_9SPHN|nr:substrate-binding domain-containing protein [Erythrobacter ramosus]MBB3774483.1 phosphate transport system substrate-binding protein [Erythrobacter ramosus]
MAHSITKFFKVGGLMALGAATLTACDSGDGSANQSVHAVGSSTVYPFAKLVAENFARSFPDKRSPLIESTGTGNGIQLFCSGLGPNTPDMVNASRRMKPSEFDSCASNKVDEIIELQVGLDGIAFASAKGGIMLNLSPKTIYEALAAQPYGRPQTAKTWKDVDPALPADPILVYGPPSTSGTRDALKELVMEVGCKTDPAMKALKDSNEDEYRKICTEVRDDGGYVDQGEQDNLIVQKIVGNPRAVGVFGYSYLEENADRVQGLPMNGVDPTYDNIASFKYPGARPLFVYVKKEHMRAIPGLEDFMKEWVKSWGKTGPLAKVGMVAMPDEAMTANAAKVQNMILLTKAELEAK